MKQHWPVKKLGDVAERVTVGHVGTTSSYYADEGVLFLRTQNVGKDGIELKDVKYITPEFHASLKKSEVKPGDVLMTRVITHTVKCALVPENLGPANCANVVLVRPGANLIPEYLIYYIRSTEAQRHLLSKKVGSAQLVVNTNVVKNWPIPIPSPEEQQRIVAILDEAFTDIAIATANAEKNLQNARELFESTLQAVFAEKGELWEEKCLGDIAKLINGKAYKKQELLNEGKYPVLRVGNFFTNKNWYYSDLELSEDKYCDNGDLLYAWSASFGPRIWDGGKAIYHYHIWKVVPNLKYVTKEFLFNLFLWDMEKIKEEQGAGTTMIHVSMNSMNKRVVPVPPVNEQQQMVNRLQELSKDTKCLEEIYKKKLNELEELKQSILQKAFAGELH